MRDEQKVEPSPRALSGSLLWTKIPGTHHWLALSLLDSGDFRRLTAGRDEALISLGSLHGLTFPEVYEAGAICPQGGRDLYSIYAQ